ncbi:hypothetical protein C5E12_11510 [Rathayibacter rathayi]|uniref:hypothetical protein n=1 Tax=Rathayibacter rathayi TaxID=33887 RepID=UPI000CE7B6F8|nr:hypothetical protein [Rathayibacter rathayi]PPI68809.1 hypothetical protein C5E12_11510 [Rathayibacter rathayi]
MQSDANAVIYGADGSVKWFTGTRGSDLRLGLANNGELVVVDSVSVLWTSQVALPSSSLSAPNGLDAGSLLRSVNGAYRAQMQGEGTFVVSGRSGPVWSTGISARGSSFNAYDDGLLAVVTEGGSGAWTASASPSSVGPYRLVMQDDGNLVQHDGQNRASWSIR